MPLEFEEENLSTNPRFTSRSILGSPTTPKMIQILLKTGVVKNEIQAGYVLLIIALISFSLAIYISYSFVFNRNALRKLSPEQQAQREEFMERIRQGQPPLPPTQPL